MNCKVIVGVRIIKKKHLNVYVHRSIYGLFRDILLDDFSLSSILTSYPFQIYYLVDNILPFKYNIVPVI